MFYSKYFLVCGLCLCAAACSGDNANLEGSGPGSTEALQDGQVVALTNSATRLAIAVDGASTSNSAGIVQQAGNGSAAQQWRATASSQGAYQLVNVGSGKCLEVTDGSKAPNGALRQFDCVSGGQSNQLWWFHAMGADAYTLVNVNSGLVVGAPANAADGAALVQQVPDSSAGQAWSTGTGGGTANPNTTTNPNTNPGAGTGTGNGGTPSAGNGNDAWVRAAIVSVMNTPHTLATGELRGGPGNFEKLTPAQVTEYIASITDCANRYLPTQLPFEQRAALIIADVSAESAFVPGTGTTAGTWTASMGPQQVTPSIWVPFFQAHGTGTGLTHYDGSAWTPASTTLEMMATSIWDDMHVANWAISIQALNGGHDPNVGPGGPMAATWWTGLYCWVSGYPAANTGGDVVQSSHYRALQVADLTLLGFPQSLVDAPYTSRPIGD